MAQEGLTGPELQVWRTFIEMIEQLRARLEQQLQASGVSYADYSVLAVLSEAPGGRMRPYEFSRIVGWEKSRLHHQLTRMSSRGLITRERYGARGIYAAITPKGLGALKEAAPSHAQEVRRLVIDCLSPDKLDQLGVISATIRDNLQAHQPAS